MRRDTNTIIIKINRRNFIFITIITVVLIITRVTPLNLDLNYPIIYEDPQNGVAGRPTYFGYSLITYSKRNQTWIQIGAPRGNDSNHVDIDEPGIVYRCNFGDRCNIFTYDSSGNEKIDGAEYVDKRDHGWLGGTMAIHPTSDLLVVCAHRWKNQKHTDYHIPGACYTHSAYDDDYEGKFVYKTIPLMGHYTRTVGNLVYEYAMAQVGTSAYFPINKGSDDSEVILGAPGMRNWRGTTVLLQDSRSLPNHSNRKRDLDGFGNMGKTIVAVPSISNVKDGDYDGYSVASGYFFSPTERLYVSSAPRANSFRGQVMIYYFPKKNRETIRFVQKILGDNGVGYFGASLQVADLNNDGYDDLLVSSPTLKVPTVSIFLGSPRRSLVVPSTGLQKLQGGPIIDSNSRFGLAMAVSDLDNDGYKEILIGAPFADNRKGVVAIWRGGADGPVGSGAPASILHASDFHGALLGFGISIDARTDLDDNDYPDVAIGSFVSGHAVVLRSRPVIKMELILNLTSSKLIRSSSSIDVELCVNTYLRTQRPLSVTKIKRILSIDKVFKRAYLARRNPSEHVYTDIKDHNPGSSQCETLKIILKEKIINFLDPIEVTLNATVLDYVSEMRTILISKDVIKGKDEFDMSYPVSEVASARLGIPFETDCGSDNICNADLSVTVSTEKETFIIGSSNILKLNITVENRGEPAYLTDVIIDLPKMTYLALLPSICTDKQAIMCNIDNPLQANSAKSLLIEIDMHEVVANIQNVSNLPFKAQAITKSELMYPHKSEYTYNLKLGIDASVLIAGKSSQNTYSYTKSKDDKVESVKFTHMYEVQKYGVSPIEEVLITVDVPYALKMKSKTINFVKIYKPEGYQAGQPFACQDNSFSYEQDDTDTYEEGTTQEVEEIVKRNKRRAGEYFVPLFVHDDYFERAQRDGTRSKRSPEYKNIEQELPSNRTVRISCDQKEVVCLTVTCSVGPFHRPNIISRLHLTMKVDIAAIQGPVMGVKDILIIKSDGYAIIPNSKFNESSTRVSSIFISTPKVEVALWLIILSVVLGLLLLTLIIIGLVKAGFFERKKKQELEDLIQSQKNEKINPDGDWTDENLQDYDASFDIDERFGKDEK